MIVKNEMKLEFPSRSCNEAFARATVGAFLASANPTLEELGDIKTAVSEAVTNAIVHGYPGTMGTITLQCSLTENNEVTIAVKDEGIGIPDIQKARMPLFTTGGEERSGMGFTIMEKFMQKLTVESTLGEGTVVTMSRTLQGEMEL